MTSGGSILSFPDRGPWGNRYRGNCSGHAYRRVFEALLALALSVPLVTVDKAIRALLAIVVDITRILQSGP